MKSKAPSSFGGSAGVGTGVGADTRLEIKSKAPSSFGGLVTKFPRKSKREAFKPPLGVDVGAENTEGGFGVVGAKFGANDKLGVKGVELLGAKAG
jgi:hypothetical protein